MGPQNHAIYLWSHMHFVLDYNGDQIVVANVTEKTKEIELPDEYSGQESMDVTFTYSATWRENAQQPFKTRHQKDGVFFPKTLEIHWLSIINSAVLVLLLVGFVLLILTRMLNKDFAQYSKENDEELDDELAE